MNIKNAIYLLRFSAYMLTTLPNFYKAKRLTKQGKVEEATNVAYRQGKDWSRFIFRMIRSEVNVKNSHLVPKDGPVVFMSNHQGFFDIPILMYAVPRPIGFISKQEIKKIPLIGTWMTYIHCIFMDRSNVRQSLKAINAAAETVKKGHAMVIYPEGTRSKGPVMNEFKSGSFKLAIKANAQIVPVTINDSYKLASEGLNVQPGKVEVVFSEPIATEGLSSSELSELPDRVKAAIQKHIRSVE